MDTRITLDAIQQPDTWGQVTYCRKWYERLRMRLAVRLVKSVHWRGEWCKTSTSTSATTKEITCHTEGD
jgi:hypothetical protein